MFQTSDDFPLMVPVIKIGPVRLMSESYAEEKVKDNEDTKMLEGVESSLPQEPPPPLPPPPPPPPPKPPKKPPKPKI